MRELIKEFVHIVTETLPFSEPVFEFGSFQVPGQEGFADLRHFFQGKEYVGCDMRPGPGVDRILNLHEIDLPSDSVGTALLVDTLEHVEYCRKAVEEVFRILKPGGLAVISSVMNYPIHDHPHDYWRFTPEAFQSLLTPFSMSFVDFAGDVNFPHTVIGIGVKGKIQDAKLKLFEKRIDLWKEKWIKGEPLPLLPIPVLWRKWAKLFLPPVFVMFYRRIRYGRNGLHSCS